LFTKHNYGNLKSSTKFVRITDEHLEYFKSSEATDSGTRCKHLIIKGVLVKFFALFMENRLQGNYRINPIQNFAFL
jgi:hypothetical protein